MKRTFNLYCFYQQWPFEMGYHLIAAHHFIYLNQTVSDWLIWRIMSFIRKADVQICSPIFTFTTSTTFWLLGFISGGVLGKFWVPKLYTQILTSMNCNRNKLHQAVTPSNSSSMLGIPEKSDTRLSNATFIFLLYCTVFLLLSLLTPIQTCQAAPQK